MDKTEKSLKSRNFSKRGIDFLEKFKSLLHENGYKYISGKYINKKSKIFVEGPDGETYTTTWWDFSTRNIRPHRKTQVSLSKIRSQIEELGYQLLSNYKGAKETLVVQKDGIQYETTWDMMRQGKVPHRKNHKKTFEEVKQELLAIGYQLLSEEYINNQTPITVKCPEGHINDIRRNSLMSGHRCPSCQTSVPETEIREHLEKLGFKVLQNDRKILNGKEIDLYLPDLKLGIEYHGLYWHSEAQVKTNYHLEKLQACQERGIQLIQIFEDEWLERSSQVLNFIESKLGINQRIFARKCHFGKLNNLKARKFLDDYHIQGSPPSKSYYGLYYQDELVQIMAFGKHHRQNSNDWLLSRMCTKRGYQIIGGASKLLKNAMKSMGVRSVSTFADLRYSEGQVYQAVGFEEVSRLKPDYSYIKGKNRYSKQSLKKTPEEKETRKTEHELRLKQGYLRIYDCGKIKYIYNSIL